MTDRETDGMKPSNETWAGERDQSRRGRGLT